MADTDGLPPDRADHFDIREHEAYWDQRTPTPQAIADRAALLANDASAAIDLQIGRIRGWFDTGNADDLWKAFIDAEFLIAALWRMRVAGNLAHQAVGSPRWSPVDRFDQALPDLKRMRDVSQHIDAYGRDYAKRKHSDVGRRALHTSRISPEQFHWLGCTLNFDLARTAAFALLADIRGVRDQGNP